MSKPSYRRLSALITVIVVALALTIAWLQQNQSNQIAQRSARGEDNFGWDFYSLERALSHFQSSLHLAMDTPGDTELLDTLSTQYNIIANRIGVIDRGLGGDIMRSNPAYARMVERWQAFEQLAGPYLNDVPAAALPVSALEVLRHESAALQASGHQLILEVRRVEVDRNAAALGSLRDFSLLANAANLLLLALTLGSALIALHQLGQQRKIREELADARDAAELANRAKSDFLASMSHELRTPLNGIIGSTQLLGQSELTAWQQRQAERLLHSATVLRSLINDILDLSKIEAGKLQLDATPFELRALLTRTVAGFAAQAEAKGIAMALDIDTKAMPSEMSATRYIGDPLRIEQVLTNLLGNALKFTEAGSVTITLGGTMTRAHMHVINIDIADTGIGMDTQQQAGLFAPFHQAESSIYRRFGGSGLGLHICHNLLTQMGGGITVRSVPGQGSCFSITLPLIVARSDEMSSSPPVKYDAATRLLTGRNILVVDDQVINREVACDALELAGATVVVASCGNEAITTVAERHATGATPFDAILMDVQMPDMDGYETTRCLRADVNNTGVPIIAMTAHGRPEDEARSLASGMNAHLTKPLDVMTLLTTLRHWLPVAEAPSINATSISAPPAHWGNASAQPLDERRERSVENSLIDMTACLRRMRGGRPAFFKLLRLFNDEYASWYARFQAADDTRRARLLHDLKSVSGQLFLVAVHEHAVALDIKIDAGTAITPDEIDLLALALEQTLALAGELLAGEPGVQSGTELSSMSQPPVIPKPERADG